MRKIYFLRHLKQLFLAVKFASDSLQYCSDSCFAFATFLLRLSVKKSQQCLQSCIGVLMFFQGSLKEKHLPG